jgi:hypothetical protein
MSFGFLLLIFGTSPWFVLPLLAVLSAILMRMIPRDQNERFEVVVEGTPLRWGWAHQRDLQQSVDLARIAKNAYRFLTFGTPALGRWPDVLRGRRVDAPVRPLSEEDPPQSVTALKMGRLPRSGALLAVCNTGRPRRSGVRT